MSKMKIGTFTGARDANGKEICVGDKLRHRETGAEVIINQYGAPIGATSGEKVMVSTYNNWVLAEDEVAKPSPSEHDALVAQIKENNALREQLKNSEYARKRLEDEVAKLIEEKANLNRILDTKPSIEKVLEGCNDSQLIGELHRRDYKLRITVTKEICNDFTN